MPRKKQTYKPKTKLLVRKTGRQRAYGTYDPATKEIEVDPRLLPDHEFYVICHEVYHHAHPKAEEAEVIEKSTIMATELWSHNARLVKQAKPREPIKLPEH